MSATRQPTIWKQFEVTAHLYSQNHALEVQGHVFTYQRLYNHVLKWKDTIQNSLNFSPKRIGIYAYRSEASYLAVLTCLAQNATFVPLNPSAPKQRNLLILQLADLDAIIIESKHYDALKPYLANLKKPLSIFLANDIQLACVHQCPTQKKDILAVSPFSNNTNPVYLLFTSGSTGVPKGVPVSEDSLNAFLKAANERYQIQPSDRLSQTFDQTFDLSIFDMFMSWLHGACLCVPQKLELLDPVHFVKENSITIWFSVPSLAALALRRPLDAATTLPSLRLIIFCGEALQNSIALFWSQLAPQSVIENVYGPTELTLFCSAYRWQRGQQNVTGDSDIVPIGYIFQNLNYAIIDPETLLPVENGNIGELCVTGPQCFEGYWNRPDLTEKAFLPTAHYYRTGDLVHWDSNLGLIFHGRRDRQIKLGGYRIELGEIEAAIRECSAVVDAAVIAYPQNSPTKDYLIAYATGSLISAEIIQTHLKQRIPSYMWPRQIVIRDELPLNANGKVDYNALQNAQ